MDAGRIYRNTTGADGGATTQTATVAAGDTVTIGSNYIVATYQASQGLKTLNTNDTVETAKGVIYQYIGPSGTQIDLSNSTSSDTASTKSADFSDTTTWRRLASAGDVYTYIGATGAINLNNQNYSNTSFWLPVNTAVQSGATHKDTNAQGTQPNPTTLACSRYGKGHHFDRPAISLRRNHGPNAQHQQPGLYELAALGPRADAGADRLHHMRAEGHQPAE